MLYDERQLYREGYNKDQVNEIVDGQMAGVDVSIYAKKNFLAIQMRQIRLGLIDGLDVTEYAHDFYDWFQMEEIRKGLAAGINIEKYAAPSVTYDRMKQVREGLIEGIDLSPHIRLDAEILRVLRHAIRDNADISEFMADGYEARELEEILYAIRAGLDVRPYIHKSMYAEALHEIVCGLEDNLDVTRYNDVMLNWRQMQEIRIGLKHRLDVSYYCNRLYSWQQMREIRLGLEEGLDVSRYNAFLFSHSKMKQIRESMRKAENNPQELPVMPQKKGGAEEFSLIVSEDEMEVYLCVYDRIPQREDVYRALQERGVVQGILDEAIEKLLSGPNQTGLVAEGVRPTRGADGYYEYFIRIDEKKYAKILEDGTADYTDVQWFAIVEKKQKLAVYHDAEIGECGCTVTGKSVPGRKGREKGVLTGSGIRLLADGRTYAADMDGRAELGESYLNVTKLLIIDELTLLTGSIYFDGSVYVRGNVGSGTRIKASGDILVDGIVENAQLEAEGSILLKGGADGAEYIHAGIDIAAKFFKNTLVAAGGSIQSNYSIDSELSAGNRIHMIGAKSAVIGGVAQAQLLIDVHDAGSPDHSETMVCCELLEKAKQLAEELEQERSSGNKEMRMLLNAQADYKWKYPPHVRNTMEVYIKLENAISVKNKEMRAVLDKHAKLQRLKEQVAQAKIIIRGNVYSGVDAVIDGCQWHAKEQGNIEIYKNGQGLQIDADGYHNNASFK